LIAIQITSPIFVKMVLKFASVTEIIGWMVFEVVLAILIRRQETHSIPGWWKLLIFIVLNHFWYLQWIY